MNAGNRIERAMVSVTAPASSANVGPGFDVFGLALELRAEIGRGAAPPGAQNLDAHHPASKIYAELGGRDSIWLRSSIPMARGLGFSGAVRVAAAGLGVVEAGAELPAAEAQLGGSHDQILRVAAEHEGHGDNVAASLWGGFTIYSGGTVVCVTPGPVMREAVVLAWVPEAHTSTDASRRALSAAVDRSDAVHNLGRAVQVALAFERDDPSLLEVGLDDRLHQPARLPGIADASAAIERGRQAGAWCAWLSGSGPTVAMLCPPDRASAVAAALPGSGHVKRLSIASGGVRCER